MSRVVVRCADYVHEAKDRAAAERWLARLDAAGTCPNFHTIEDPEEVIPPCTTDR